MNAQDSIERFMCCPSATPCRIASVELLHLHLQDQSLSNWRWSQMGQCRGDAT